MKQPKMSFSPKKPSWLALLQSRVANGSNDLSDFNAAELLQEVEELADGVTVPRDLLQTLIDGCDEASDMRKRDAEDARDSSDPEQEAICKRKAEGYEQATRQALALVRSKNPLTCEQPVTVRRAIVALMKTTKPAGRFEDWQAAYGAARSAYLTLFSDEEKRCVVSWARLPRPGCMPDEPIETFEQAIAFYGTSLLREALGDSI